jgi:hypothetical protein
MRAYIYREDYSRNLQRLMSKKFSLRPQMNRDYVFLIISGTLKTWTLLSLYPTLAKTPTIPVWWELPFGSNKNILSSLPEEKNYDRDTHPTRRHLSLCAPP